jgi:ribosomal protein L11 methyltransferase
MDPDHGLVVVAAHHQEVEVARRDLGAQGARAIEVRPVGRGRCLLYGCLLDDLSARDAVAALRSAGWPATVRPRAGGHLAAWRTCTRPVKVEERLWVCFPWSEFDRDAAPDMVEIDPGRAFGTGDHPSTRLLLTELADRLRGGERVLDVGCGSGVLSVCAARLGAASVVAIDIDRNALAATSVNAARNGVGNVDVSPAGIDEVAGVFDVIVANIGAATLIELASSVQSRLGTCGWLGLSGLSPAQVSRMAAAYSDLAVVSVRTDDDWAAVVASRPERISSVSAPSRGAGLGAGSGSADEKRAGYLGVRTRPTSGHSATV